VAGAAATAHTAYGKLSNGKLRMAVVHVLEEQTDAELGMRLARQRWQGAEA
jgi:hypothetical protein